MPSLSSTRSTLSYRLYQAADKAGILRLWAEHSGWGGITEEQFEEWYLNTPHGSCLIVVAEDEAGELVGQMVFMPSRVCIHGHPVPALRALAPILHTDCRNLRLTHREHPALALYQAVREPAREQGYGLIYTFPAQGWQAFMAAFPRHGLPPWHIVTYGCYQLKGSTLNEVSHRVQVKPADTYAADYDLLWEQAVHEFPLPAAIERRTAWLHWKQGRHLLLEGRDARTQVLTGYLAVNRASGLIEDALAATPTRLYELLAAASHYWSVSPPAANGGLKGLLLPVLKPILQQLPYTLIDYTFVFGYQCLNADMANHCPDITAWFVMPND